MFISHLTSRLTITLIILGLASHAVADSASNFTNVDLEAYAKIAKLPGDVVADFEDEDTLSSLSLKGDFTQTTILNEPSLVKSGKGSLKITADDKADKRIGGRPVVNIKLGSKKTLSGYQAIKFWLYVSPAASEYFFGRYDVVCWLGKPQVKNSWSAVTTGWHLYIWDLKNVETMPDFDSINIQLGPLMEGYKKANFYFDDITLVPMDEVTSGSDLTKTALNDKSWSRRYSAIKALARSQNNALKAFIKACGDESATNRALAVKVMSDYVTQHGKSTISQLKKGMANPNWRVRLAVLELIANVEKELGDWAETVFQNVLFDEIFYVRNFARKHYIGKGMAKAEIAAKVTPSLASKDQLHLRAAIRTLSEIGPRAYTGIPQLLAILRNRDNDLQIRFWALRALWEIDENVLTPADWGIGLNLKPGEIHRHLLNRTMDRLEIAGSKAVPALVSALYSDNPQVISRACVVLGAIGQDADMAVSQLQRVAQDDRWYVASEANEALKKILPNFTASPIENKSVKVGTDVIVSRSGSETTISNGLVEIVFEEGDDNPGPKIVRTPGGKNVVDASWLPKILAFRYSKSPNMIERQWYQKLFGSPFPQKMEMKLVSSTPEAADFMIKFIADEKSLIDWEFHYVLRKGDSGFYNYNIVRNMSGQEMPGSSNLGGQVGVGRYTYLLGLTWGMYDHLFIHDKLKGVAAFTDYVDEFIVEDYPDIYQSAFRMPDGDLFAKHEWENYELISPVNGYAGKNGGFWMIYPSLDFFHDSMPRHQATSVWGNLFVPHLEGKYYMGVTAYMTKDWEKMYGPLFFYINDGETVEEMWTDAKLQAEKQKAQWPYEWLPGDIHQDRGSLTGNVQIANRASPEGAFVVLSNPTEAADPDQISLWMRNMGAYNYWTEVNADGSFSIDNIHSGSYGLYVFKPGIHGELNSGQITVNRGKTTDTGKLILTPEQKGELVWQIGVPDGGMTEYQNGNNYHMWDNYIRYREDFPEDVHYIVGQSDWTKDWNYMHPATVKNEWKPITWTIDFDLNESPSDKHLLTIVCAGRSAHAKIILNGQEIGKLDVSIGANHARTCPYGELVQKEFAISPDLLQNGKNRLHITFDLSVEIKEGWHEAPAATQNLSWTSWLAYDFIRLEKLN